MPLFCHSGIFLLWEDFLINEKDRNQLIKELCEVVNTEQLCKTICEIIDKQVVGKE